MSCSFWRKRNRARWKRIRLHLRHLECDRQFDFFPTVRLPAPLTQCGYGGSIKCGKTGGLDDGDVSYRARLQIEHQVKTTNAHMVPRPVCVGVLWPNCLDTIVEPRSALSTAGAMTYAFGIHGAGRLTLAEKCIATLRRQGTRRDGICTKGADNERAQAHLTRTRSATAGESEADLE